MKELISKNRIVIVLFMAIIGLSAGCSKDDNNKDNGGSGGPGANEVWIQSFAFNPVTITVTAGTTVKWTNKDGTTHTITSTTNVFDSGNVLNNGTFSFTFATPGTYPYFCKLHPTMTGTVVVN
jgi:plastocyanin